MSGLVGWAFIVLAIAALIPGDGTAALIFVAIANVHFVGDSIIDALDARKDGVS